MVSRADGGQRQRQDHGRSAAGASARRRVRRGRRLPSAGQHRENAHRRAARGCRPLALARDAERRDRRWLAAGQDVVLACSALKRSYRQILDGGRPGCASLSVRQPVPDPGPPRRPPRPLHAGKPAREPVGGPRGTRGRDHRRDRPRRRTRSWPASSIAWVVSARSARWFLDRRSRSVGKISPAIAAPASAPRRRLRGRIAARSPVSRWRSWRAPWAWQATAMWTRPNGLVAVAPPGPAMPWSRARG